MVTLTGAATMAGSALEKRTDVSVVAVLEMATVTVEVVATLKAGVAVMREEMERAGGGGGIAELKRRAGRPSIVDGECIENRCTSTEQ